MPARGLLTVVMDPLIRTASLRGFAALVRDLGGDPATLSARFGIAAADLESEDGLISITAHDRLLDAAAAELNCPDLGLRLADAQDVTILGPLALAIESSSNAAEAVACASQFMFVHSPALSVAVEADPRGAAGVAALTYRKNLLESPYSPQAIELGLGVMHRVFRDLVGIHPGMRSVQVPHRPLSPIARYTGFFGVDVQFGRSPAALRVDRGLLDERFHGANEVIRRHALDYLARYTDPSATVTSRVRSALAERLGSTAPTLTGVARLLAVNPRTLQRRLTDEGTSFAAVLDGVRRAAAHRYITTTDMPFTQVSALLGFSEQSALTRATRRWFGVGPRALRNDRPGG